MADESDSDSLSPLTMSCEMAFQPQGNASSTEVFDKTADSLNVVDVYNIASSVGQEFERLTDAFGGAVFSGVMPKIIRILEMLEALVAKREDESDEITELNASLQQLQVESKLKDEKQQEEIDIVESAWKDETRDLLQSVTTLEEDNQKLVSLLSEKIQEESDDDVKVMPEQQNLLISKLQEQISKQRDEIRAKNNLIEEQSHEAEALQSQIQRLSKLNVDIRNKVVMLEQQGKLLIAQRSELEAKLHDGRNMAELHLKSIQGEKKVDNIAPTESKKATESFTTTDGGNPIDPLLANKLVIDLKDPNRPRYTLQELQEVLNDRNQLKARCFLLEEELIFHRGLARKHGFDENWVELNESEIRESRDHAEKNDSKPQESGIRRFFSYITGDSMWRKHESRKSSPKKQKIPQTTHHHVLVDDNDVNRLTTDDVEDFLPDIRIDSTQTDEPRISEMKVISPVVDEIDDFTP